MFPLLLGEWTPAVPLGELTGNPQAVEVAGERLVVVRDGDGAWHALLDRCPHRGAALSLGTVMDDGTLQCRYHGWRFRGDGACTKVPLNDLTAKAVGAIRATAVPVLELAGALWVHTSILDPANPPPPPELPASLAGPPREYGTYSQVWQAHWTRAVENFIDFAHPSYLHRATIGAWTHDYAEGGAVATVEVEPESWGFRTLNYFGNRRQGFRVDWYRPNQTVLHFGAGTSGKLHVFSIPVSADRTRVMTVRRLPPGMDLAAWNARAAAVDHTILDEDRVVVESQAGPVDDAGEISVGTDAPSVAFRRWQRTMLAGPQSR
ncbi:MAG: aromatic ring-hydroxylating dioxygenase subunit alpha [Gammaproteobacteria bacterium]|nr:aromatic ring-hydroxylating dioxygenase subunit alpha [Gammaproteobacteria bacterium]